MGDEFAESMKIDANFVVLRLNEFLSLDAGALQQLVDNRVEVCESFRNTDVNFVCGERDGKVEIGIIGLLNSMVENGQIAAVYSDGSIEKFTVVSGS